MPAAVKVDEASGKFAESFQFTRPYREMILQKSFSCAYDLDSVQISKDFLRQFQKNFFFCSRIHCITHQVDGEEDDEVYSLKLTEKVN